MEIFSCQSSYPRICPFPKITYFFVVRASCPQSLSYATESTLKNGALKTGLSSSVWQAKSGYYPMPSICFNNKISEGIIYLSGINLTYASGESAEHVLTTITLPKTAGNDTLTWKSSNETALAVDEKGKKNRRGRHPGGFLFFRWKMSSRFFSWSILHSSFWTLWSSLCTVHIWFPLPSHVHWYPGSRQSIIKNSGSIAV